MIILGDAKQLKYSDFNTRFGVIVADPPWPYRVSKGQGTAKEQYQLMTDDGIYAMRVSELAAPDSVLLLWERGRNCLKCFRLCKPGDLIT